MTEAWPTKRISAGSRSSSRMTGSNLWLRTISVTFEAPRMKAGGAYRTLKSW